VVPVTSRVRFLSRRVQATEAVTVKVKVPDGADLKWAHVHSADTPPYRAKVEHDAAEVWVEIHRHGSTSMLVIGKGIEPALEEADVARIDRLRENLFPYSKPLISHTGEQTTINAARQLFLRVEGTQVGEWGTVAVHVDGKKVGQISGAFGAFALNQKQNNIPSTPPRVSFVTPDEGMWFVPQRVELIVNQPDGSKVRVAEWNPEKAVSSGISKRELVLPLEWCKREAVEPK